MLSLKFFSRYLLTSKSDSVVKTVSRICVIGVAVGVSAFIIVLSVMNGFNSSTRKRYLTVEPHIVFNSQAIKNSDIQNDLVESIHDFEIQDIFIRTDENFAAAIAKGLSKKALLEMFEPLERAQRKPIVDVEVAEGYQPPTLSEMILDLKPGEVIVGVDLARNSGFMEGDAFNILPPESLILPAGQAPLVERAIVKGVFTTNIPTVDSHYMFYVKGETLTTFQTTASRQTGKEVRLTSPEKYDSYLQDIGVTEGYETWVDRNASLFLALKLERWTMTLFLSLAALITSFTVITVLILLITQKKLDLGVLLTLGMSQRRLQFMFTVIGLLLFAIGFLGGLVFGVSVSALMQAYPLEVLPAMYYERTIPSRLDFSLVFLMSFVAIIVGMLTAWLPAKRLSSMSPVDMIKKS